MDINLFGPGIEGNRVRYVDGLLILEMINSLRMMGNIMVRSALVKNRVVS